jgi:hypothetical protein
MPTITRRQPMSSKVGIVIICCVVCIKATPYQLNFMKAGKNMGREMKARRAKPGSLCLFRYNTGHARVF